MSSRATVETGTHWSVREGLAKEVAFDLTGGDSEVLAFLVHGEDPQTRRKKFDVLRQVAGLLHELVDNRRQQKWEALVEALTPDLDLSPTRIIEAQMLSSARVAVLESRDFVPAAAIAEAAQFSTKNPSSQPNRWKRNRQIFTVSHKGVDLYPLFALDQQGGFRPLPIVARILEVFADKKDGWATAFWFESVNSYLKNRKPKDLLVTDPERVLRAAEVEAAGVQHG
jgi:hypothetical protein